jgi:hypothetical protein
MASVARARIASLVCRKQEQAHHPHDGKLIVCGTLARTQAATSLVLRRQADWQQIRRQNDAQEEDS